MTPDGHPQADSRQGGAGRFDSTHWSVVMAAAQTHSPAAEEAMARLCRDYWYPLYAFLRRKGCSPEEAEDLTQEFFATRVLTRRLLASADPARGRFRTWLLRSLQNFLLNELERHRAEKRGGGRALLPLEPEGVEERYSLGSTSRAGPENSFDRDWAITLLQRAMVRIQQQYERTGAAAVFAELKRFLPGAGGAPSYAEAASRLGKTEAAIKMAVSRLRRDYGLTVRSELKRTVSTPEELEDELRMLMEVLGE